MGNACEPKKVVARLRAEAQRNGLDPFEEADRIKDFGIDALAAYEQQMAKLLGNDYKSVAPTMSSVLKKTKVPDSAPRMDDTRYWRTPSDQLPPQFYKGVEKKLLEWQKTGGKDGDYGKLVAKPAQNLAEALKTVISSSNSKGELSKALKPFGLTPDTVYEARSWIKWLGEGGPTQQANDKGLNWVVNRISQADSKLRPIYTLGNLLDLTRVATHFATKRPEGVIDVIKGINNAIKAGNPFLPSKELIKLGLGHIDAENKGFLSKIDPFPYTNNLQRNLAFHIDKVQGGDGITGVKQAVFERPSWDRAIYDRSPDARPLWGLARYSIGEAMWYTGNMKRALSGDKQAIATMATHHALKFLLTGSKSLIPSFAWMAFKKEDKEAVEAFDKQFNGNLLARSTSGAIDLSEYTQPYGGTLGARAQSIWRTGVNSGKSGVKAVADITQGQLGAGVIDVLSAAAGINILTDKLSYFKAVMPDNTTAIKLYSTIADQLKGKYEEGWADDKFKRDLFEDALGQAYHPNEE